MSTDLDNLDPAWAWAPYDPDARRPWTRALAAHLFRRAGFSATGAELDDAVKSGHAATIERLCDPPASPASTQFEASVESLAQRTVAANNAQALPAWWLYRMLGTSDPLLEILTLFWHGHFATSAAKVEKPRMMLAQNELLRARARG
jgi:uncharacterized protein (DUF1800 family)